MEWISLLVTFLLGGGVMALLTIKPQKRKVEAEADQASATADTTKIQNLGQIAEEWKKFAEESELRYSSMNKLMQNQIETLQVEVAKLSKQLNQILKIIKEINHDNLEQKKQEAKDIAGT